MVKNIIQTKSGMTIKCWCEWKNPKENHVFEKKMFGILLHVLAKMVNIQELLLVIQCDEIVEVTKIIPTKLLHEKPFQ